MDLKAQKRMYAVIILVMVAIIGGCVYFLLGGFDEVIISREQGQHQNIVGKYFQGYYAHPDLKDMWEEARQMVAEGQVPGQLALVNYRVDSLDNDEVAQFIGIAISGGMAEVPAGFEVLEIDLREKVTVFMPMHPLVRPRPHVVEGMIADFAASNGLVLDNFTLELHGADNSLTVEMSVRSVE